MARKNKNFDRTITPDPKYGDILIAKSINYLMLEGKKSVAQRIVYDAFEILAKSTKQDPVEVFKTAIKNITPAVEVRSRRVGGANYQVPVEVNSKRQLSLALRWLLEAARKRKGAPMCERFAAEVLDAYNKVGSVMRKKEDTHRMAEANRAFAHLN
jgi:small subunit ribosomal protein S7